MMPVVLPLVSGVDSVDASHLGESFQGARPYSLCVDLGSVRLTLASPTSLPELGKYEPPDEVVMV